MTSRELNTDIEILRQEYLEQRRHWLRWGFASYAIAMLLCFVVLIRVAITGDNPPTPMIFIVLTYLFLGFTFITAGRSLTFPRFRRW